MPNERTTVPLISVIVPIYNVHAYLPECLDSICNQTLQDIQIICVNDGSSDSSLDIVREYAARDPRIEIIDKQNAGYGHTINRGLEAAKGEYISIVESDDFIEQTMLETLYAAAHANEADIVRVNYWLYWSKPEPKNEFLECYFPDMCNKIIDPRQQTSCFFFPPALWSMLAKRNIITKMGLRLLETPGASYQDTSFSFKLWACASRAWLIHEPYLHYRQDNESSSINAKDKAYFVCDEYREIERFIKDDLKDPQLLPLANKRKYDAYVWNLTRINPALRPEFARQAASEFAQALNEGHLQQSVFSSEEWTRITQLMNAPDEFILETFDNKTSTSSSLSPLKRVSQWIGQWLDRKRA